MSTASATVRVPRAWSRSARRMRCATTSRRRRALRVGQRFRARDCRQCRISCVAHDVDRYPEKVPLISQVNSGWAGALWAAARPEAEPSQSNISNGTAELLCLVSLLFLVGLVAWMVTRGRPPSNRTPGPGPLSRHDRTTDPWAAIPTSEMASEADAALVAADDSLQTSQQEMDF